MRAGQLPVQLEELSPGDDGRTLILHHPSETVRKVIDITGIATLRVIELQPERDDEADAAL